MKTTVYRRINTEPGPILDRTWTEPGLILDQEQQRSIKHVQEQKATAAFSEMFWDLLIHFRGLLKSHHVQTTTY